MTIHVPGKFLHTADTLSRAPLSSTVNNLTVQEEAEYLSEMTVSNLPAKDRLDAYKQGQVTDPIISRVFHYCREGWPRKEKVEYKH